MSHRLPAVCWRTWLDLASLLLLGWLLVHLVDPPLAQGVQALLWTVHEYVSFVPQIGDKRIIPLVHLALWLAVPLVAVMVGASLVSIGVEGDR